MLLVACASSTPVVEETKPSGEPIEVPLPQKPALSAAELSAQLDEACGAHAKFKELFGTVESDKKKLARAYIERCGLRETIELTGKLIEFPTVSARESATGEAFSAMRSYLESWSKEAGLDFKASGDNDAWEIGLGTGAPNVGFVMHGDVVPIDDGIEHSGGEKAGTIDAVTGEPLPPGWTKAPFRATVDDGKLYGRGSEDDKGPIAAVLVVMRTLSKLGLVPAGRILAIIGTGEENDWTGMRRYVEANKPQPQFVISVDANFPVVIAESGFVAWQLAAPLKPAAAGAKKSAKKCTAAIEAKGGQFLTQVPGEASMTLAVAANESLDRLASRVHAAAAEVAKESAGKLRVELAPESGRIKVIVYGDAVHSSVAETGQNALWGLAQVAERVGLCEGGTKSMLAIVSTYFAGDHWGEKLKLAHEHPAMGRLLVAPTLLRVEGEDAKLSINMRRPAGMTTAEFGAKLATALSLLQRTIDPAIRLAADPYIGEPAMANTDGPLVPTLIDIYRRESGDKTAEPISIRGGTYARLFNGAVSFGPALPGHAYRGHAPDEFVELDALSLLDRAIFEAALALDAHAVTAPRADR